MLNQANSALSSGSKTGRTLVLRLPSGNVEIEPQRLAAGMAGFHVLLVHRRRGRRQSGGRAKKEHAHGR